MSPYVDECVHNASESSPCDPSLEVHAVTTNVRPLERVYEVFHRRIDTGPT